MCCARVRASSTVKRPEGDIFYSGTDDVQKAFLVKGFGIGLRQPFGAGQGETILRKFQPWECVDDVILVVGLDTGGNTSQRSHRGGNRFPGNPLDESQGVLWMPAVSGDSERTSSIDGIPAWNHGETYVPHDLGIVPEDFRGIVAEIDHHGDVSICKILCGIGPPL